MLLGSYLPYKMKLWTNAEKTDSKLPERKKSYKWVAMREWVQIMRECFLSDHFNPLKHVWMVCWIFDVWMQLLLFEWWCEHTFLFNVCHCHWFGFICSYVWWLSYGKRYINIYALFDDILCRLYNLLINMLLIYYLITLKHLCRSFVYTVHCSHSRQSQFRYGNCERPVIVMRC